MLAIIFSLFVHFPLSADATGVDGFQAGIRLMQEQKFEEAAKQFETEYINGKNFNKASIFIYRKKQKLKL